MKNVMLMAVFVSFTFSTACVGQQTGNNRSKSLPSKYASWQNKSTYNSGADAVQQKAYDLTAALPAGYVKDGSVDYTQYLQGAITKNRNVVFPDFPIQVNEKGLVIPSNSNLVFKPNSKLLIKATDSKKYTLLAIHNVSNVKVYNARVVGEKDQHIGTEGEWGMGISVRGAENVDLINPQASNCWGDGIYVGQFQDKISKNVNIYNAVLDNNNRNGISIVSVDGLKLVSPVISNITATAIDIEPNSNDNTIDNISIEKPLTSGSKNGILIVLSKLPGKIRKNVDISIKDHVDYGSYTGFYISGFANDPLDGNIEVSNCKWINNVEPFRKKKNYASAPNVRFSNINVVTTDQSGKEVNQPQRVEQIRSSFKGQNKVIFNN